MVVLTVDAHPLIGPALREALCTPARSIELLQAPDPEQGFTLLAGRPDTDLIFLDAAFPRHDGLAFVRRFRALAPATPLIVYTMHEDEATLREALGNGASGVIPKTHSLRLLQRAVELVRAGGIYMPPELTRQLAAPRPEPARRSAAADSMAISEQQWKIVELIAQGLPNKEIARRLGLAASTVKNQLTVVFERLSVSNRTQAAIAARTFGLVRKY